MAILGQDRPNIGGGFGALGDVLGGGLGTIDQRAYADQTLLNNRGRKAGYDAERAREEASIARHMRVARVGLGPNALVTAGYSPDQAALFSNILGSNASPSLSQLGDLQVPQAGGAYAAAADAMGAGDFPGYNQQTALATGKPYQPTVRHGETFIADGATLGDIAQPGGMVTTTLGDARAVAATARAEASRAQARASDARASAAPKAPTTAALEAEALAGARQLIASGESPEDVAAHLRRKGYPDLAAKIVIPLGGY